MKKFIAFALSLFVGSAFCVFANVEMDLNYYATLGSNRNLDMDDFSGDVYVNHSEPFGLETDFGFYFGSISGLADIGLDLDVGGALFKEFTLDIDESDYDGKQTVSIGLSSFFSLGPTVRFTFNDYNSLSFTPSLKLNAIQGFSPRVSMFDFGADFKLAYKLWLVNNDGYHFGLNVGCALGLPFFARGGANIEVEDEYGDDTEIYSFGIKDGTDFRIFVGLAFNFGDRGRDR